MAFFGLFSFQYDCPEVSVSWIQLSVYLTPNFTQQTLTIILVIRFAEKSLYTIFILKPSQWLDVLDWSLYFSC